ncbi:hypothetical protein Golob_020874, partial [Gossypium lobatum]|nr:hypothetical protein [Gossypium lobatum]
MKWLMRKGFLLIILPKLIEFYSQSQVLEQAT